MSKIKKYLNAITARTTIVSFGCKFYALKYRPDMAQLLLSMRYFSNELGHIMKTET